MGILQRAARADMLPLLRCARGLVGRPQVFSQSDFIRYAGHRQIQEREFPQVLTNWDDTPRQGRRGTVILGEESDLLRENLRSEWVYSKELPEPICSRYCDARADSLDGLRCFHKAISSVTRGTGKSKSGSFPKF